MAIYHLSVKSISRSAGRSVVAAAAYRAGQELTDERQGLTHDYTRKQGVEAAFIVAPDGADWAQDRNALWNAAEAAERRKDAKTGREYELALPAELDAGARKQLARDFAAELVERYGVVADVAIHGPGREGDNRNHHAHILTTTRTAGEDGLGAKTRVLDVASTASAEIEHMRG
ncbi:conjugal transfer protein TraA, partial [Acetobacter persici]|uniref:MobQ family relaxase n=1 Tax=Acetobacter persici TaxID=1076596 RepID=UPI000B6F166E